ncbi:hypothetical protein OHA40_26775 [Nocardia sp. NBC_00508]|uniref:hypothetical protein n=1 Tax=Nocardia sp. NBC_00508 TaxID=2975992 RepID=UPI002E8107C9|nr:hypothetical protein [Nocardia sp. NBC_00508]WUD65215.1 hypothetical protein OHA40_26775 [Nocardia sp. NBC_00508]
MSTAISETTPPIGGTDAALARRVVDLDPAEDDLGYDTARRVLCGGTRSRALTPTHRSAVDRRPRDSRPDGGVAGYGTGARAFVRTQASGVHPMRRVEQAQIGFAALAVAALLTALVVAGLIALAHARSGDWGGASGGSAPAVVDGAEGHGEAHPR